MEKNVAGGDISTGSGGTSEEQKQVTSEENELSGMEEKVAFASYKKLMDEKKRGFEKKDQELKELREFRKQVELERRAAEERELAEKGEFQKLLEEKEKQLRAVTEKLTDQEKMVQKAIKLSAFKKALPGNSHIEDQYLKLVDTSQITLDESGNADKSSVDKAVKDFTKIYGRVLVTSNGSKLPQNGLLGDHLSSMTREEFRALKGSREKIKALPKILKEFKK